MKRAIVILLFAFCPLLMIQPVAAFDLFSNCVTESDGSQVCGPCASNPNAPTCQQATDQGSASSNRLTGKGNIINVASDILALAAGIAAVIIIIVGGLTMVTSGGNTEAMAGARRRIIASIIGLVIVALAWTLTRFITDKLIQ